MVSILEQELDQGTSGRPLRPRLHHCFQDKAGPALTPPSPLPGDALSQPCPPKDHVEVRDGICFFSSALLDRRAECAARPVCKQELLRDPRLAPGRLEDEHQMETTFDCFQSG